MNQHIQSKLSKLSELNVQVGLAANTITIIPDSDDKSWRIWVDPSWRIIRDNKVVMSSMECPHISQYEEEDKYREAFREWVKQIENQIKKIASIVVKPGPLDLIVTFEDGMILESFVAEKEDYTWYFYDKLERLYYEATGIGLLVEEAES